MKFLGILLFCGILAPFASVAAEMPADFSRTSPARPLPALQFKQEDGSILDMESLRGRYVVLNFWATWCVPCVKEMPSLDRLAGQMNGAVGVLAVSLDEAAADKVPVFYQKHRIQNLAVLLDSERSVSRKLRPRGLPLTLIVNRQGEEIGRVYGSMNWDTPEMVNYLNSLMSQP